METAAFLLQNLIRGRAVQLDMYKRTFYFIFNFQSILTHLLFPYHV